ncbi:MAG: hypothetical protein ABI697_10600 [Devosia sp.]
MLSPTDTIRRRPRRFWFAEALVVAAILAFGGFALLSESGVPPDQVAAGIGNFLR